MINREGLILNTTERKLLWGIYQSLQEIKDLLGGSATREQTQNSEVVTPLENLKRNEIMALVKALPDEARPEGWTRFTNIELINLLKREGV